MNTDIGENGWTHEPGEGFLALVGGYWIREASGQFDFGFRSRDIHRNRNDVVHGGMLLTFVDRAMGQTARLVTGAARSVTITMNASFLVSMKLDAFATITPSVVRRTKRMAFMEGKLMCDGQILADVHGIWRIYSPYSANV